MNFKPYRYIFLASLPLAFAAGCTEDLLLSDEAALGNSNAVKFSASVERARDNSTRGDDGSDAQQLYEPLVLNSESDDSHLYLHTYVSDKVGLMPGEDAERSTRGNQVQSVDQLIEYNKDFMVHAMRTDNAEEYIEWAPTHPISSKSDVWLTSETRYWPNQDKLSFHAVSPSDEMTSLGDLYISVNRMSFTYAAKKGKASQNKDAEAQTDLLLAASSCNKAGSVEGRAPLQFNHALSAIKFAVRDVLDGEIENITISGVAGAGKCLFSAGDDGTNGKVEWSNLSGKESYSQDFNYKLNGRPIVDPSDESQDLLLNDEMPAKTFMLIPQQIPDDAEIIIKLKQIVATDKNGNKETKTKTLRAKIKDNNISEWLPGREYIYTVSTSKSNWIYELKATGNHNSKNGKHNVNGDMIYVYSPSDKNHETYLDNAYYTVKSYRYRANDWSHIEDLPWKASHGGAEQYRVPSPGKYEIVTGRFIKATDWITDPKGLQGNGNHSSGEKHDITMAEHHLMTDWPGDKWMQDEAAYTGNSESKPWDLSTCGGQVDRTTANCYVIDREGWYCFPLYYGNGMKNGKENEDAYKYGSTYFKNHLNGDIKSYKIAANNRKSAQLVWSDVYNAISDIQLATVDGIPMIKFHANKYNLQQGNAVIAVKDKDGKIAWSWHIWITEHWLKPGDGRPHAFAAEDNAFGFTASSSGRRQRGDVLVEVDVKDPKYGAVKASRYMAPYSLGWCDPKNLDYLRRPSEMKFVQYHKDGSTTGLTASLPIVQDGARINYKYANTTYYQFGRKDPIVGFVNHENENKHSFGPLPYTPGKQTVSISTAIQNPNVLYCKGTADNWCKSNWSNFWNNGENNAKKRMTSDNTVKTVYDPCPPGYSVPSTAILHFIGTNYKGAYDDSGSIDQDSINKTSYKGTKPLANLNGTQESQFMFKLKRKAGIKNLKDKDAIWLSSTGNRWYTDSRPTLAMGGDNYNWQLAYVWSCIPHENGNGTMAYGIALGQDNNYVEEGKPDSEIDKSGRKYAITCYFQGRTSMARTVRAVREK